MCWGLDREGAYSKFRSEGKGLLEREASRQMTDL